MPVVVTLLVLLVVWGAVLAVGIGRWVGRRP